MGLNKSKNEAGEEQLKLNFFNESGSDFKTIFESIPAPYLILTPDLKIVTASDTYLKLIQNNRENIIGRKLFDVFPDDPDDPISTGVHNLKKSLNKVIQKKSADIMSVQKYNIPDPHVVGGRFIEKFWQPANYPVIDAYGELIYIIHYAEDITNYVLAQQKVTKTELVNLELRDARVFLESVLDNIPNIVFVKDGKNLSYLKVNKAFEKLVGYSQKEIMGKCDYDIFPKEQADFFRKQDKIVLESGRIIDIDQEKIETKANLIKVLHTRKVPLQNETGERIYLIGISEAL